MKVLKSRLYDLKMKEQQAKLAQLGGEKKDIAFGSQIRSYVLQPYQMVKDHRTKEQVGDVNRVLDGDIDVFIKAYLMKKAAGTLGAAAVDDDDRVTLSDDDARGSDGSATKSADSAAPEKHRSRRSVGRRPGSARRSMIPRLAHVTLAGFRAAYRDAFPADACAACSEGSLPRNRPSARAFFATAVVEDQVHRDAGDFLSASSDGYSAEESLVANRSGVRRRKTCSQALKSGQGDAASLRASRAAVGPCPATDVAGRCYSGLRSGIP